MLNVYDATGLEKRQMVEVENDEMAYWRREKQVKISDLVLVRTTNQFPKNGIVETTDKHTPPILTDSIFHQEIEEAGLNADEYKMYSFMSRRTTHWALNGLVGSHSYGNFQGRDFIIIEPFEEQVTNLGLMNINEADTWFEKDIKLSDRATILIPYERYQELSQNSEFAKEIRKYNIALFKGDEDLAVKMLLNDKGYIWADIGQWGFSWERNTETQEFAGKLEDFQEKIAEELRAQGRDVSYGRTHANSESIRIDRERLKELEEERIDQFVDYIAENTDIKFLKAYLKKFFKEREFWPNINPDNVYVTIEECRGEDMKLPTLTPKQIFEELGSERILELTHGFNEKMLEEHRKARKEKDAKILEALQKIGEGQVTNIEIYSENIAELNSKMLTGLTSEVEGDIELDGECYATTAIGKIRENQEDAVLLIKDEDNPDLKMLVVADGVGGRKRGEFASHIMVDGLKLWFENLSDEQKECYYTGIADLQESLEYAIKEESEVIDSQLNGVGGTTIVLALVGKNDTLIANVGDSRAYIAKNGDLKQITTDDSIVQEKIEEGEEIPYKDAVRFHRESSGITQAVGIELENIHFYTLSNNEYDMLLLLSDGVTDCLSEEDVAVICRTTDRSELAKKLVEKAIEHDSIAPEELYVDYFDFDMYIPGGKDNATAAVYAPQNIKKREEKLKTIQKDNEMER